MYQAFLLTVLLTASLNDLVVQKAVAIDCYFCRDSECADPFNKTASDVQVRNSTTNWCGVSIRTDHRLYANAIVPLLPSENQAAIQERPRSVSRRSCCCRGSTYYVYGVQMLRDEIWRHDSQYLLLQPEPVQRWKPNGRARNKPSTDISHQLSQLLITLQ